jgi:pyroglutamyl-peptidase
MILLTGFTPFQGVKVSPSALVLERIRHSDVVTQVLPTEYDAAGAHLIRLLKEINPSAVLCLGVAQSREAISLERIALNLDDAPIPDNAGSLRSGQPIVDGAPLAYGSTLPLDAMKAAIAALEIPVVITNHAGTFVCNHVFYTARHTLEVSGSPVPCGFVHIPALQEVDGKGLPLDRMVAAVEACLTLLREQAAIHA